jgi:hypothetical protein
MKKITENNYIRAIIGVVLLSAFTHTVILTLFGLLHMDFTVLNIFKILDLDLFFPQMAIGAPNFIWSYLFLGAEYVLIYLLLKKK